ncbi:MAG: LTA synthase family protein [Deltaproteobacteria bacterium]|nr:LTA synthase family protein [Deltaproteobacteria bacterium]
MDPSDARGSTARLALSAGAVLAAPFAVRLALISEMPGAGVDDLRGFASDAGSAALLLALLIPLTRLSRWAAVAVTGIWSLAHYANYETITGLGSVASALDAHFLADPTFLRGSALAVGHPLLLAGVLALPLGLGAWGLRRLSGRSAVACGALGAVLLGGLSLLPRSDAAAVWRQVGVAHENGGYLVRLALAPDDDRHRFPDPASAMLDVVPELAANLDGVPRVPESGRARNVLLIVLEAFSGAYVPTLSAPHGYQGLLELPELDRLAHSGLAFSTFVNHQRKTSRGMYSLLCGEPPGLVPSTPKMTEFAYRPWRECLPSVLRDAGYLTVYQQAAPLPFMLKDQFMPRAGFERVYGHEVFDQAYMRSHWGVDDRAFFEQTVARVREVRAQPRPWFLTLLTVGTHHPTIVPRGWEANKVGRLVRALRYADHYLGEFLRTLEAEGLLDDTLVLITSDEAAGLRAPSPLKPAEVQGLTLQLSENWGLMVALGSGAEPARVAEPYSQMDVALSIVDYLGLADRGRHFLGRSLFRDYAEPRWVFFANSSYVKASALDPFGHLLMCNVLTNDCRKWRVDASRAFGDQRERVEWNAETDAVVDRLARRSPSLGLSPVERRDYNLVGSETVPLDDSARTARKVVHGGQHIDLRPDQWLEIEVEVEARGGPGAIELLHYIRNSRTWSLERKGVKSVTMFKDRVRIHDGETYRLLYTVANDRMLQGVKCQSYATTTMGGDWELVFHKARMSVRSGPGRPQSGVHKIRSEVVPTPARAATPAGDGGQEESA